MLSAIVRVLEVDPDLAEDLDDDARRRATMHAVARVETLAPGLWESRVATADRNGLGLLVLEGIIGQRAKLHDDCPPLIEMIGEGDLICPWQSEEDEQSLRVSEQLTILTRTSVAVLDHKFALSIARWPEITARLVDRALRRCRSLAFHLAVAHVTRVDLRLIITLWHVANRWGRVTPEGVIIPVRLTNDMLASIIGARRPSVSTAMNVLSRRNVLSRGRDGAWILHGNPPSDLADLFRLHVPRAMAVSRPGWVASRSPPLVD